MGDWMMVEYEWKPGQEVFEPARGWNGFPGHKKVIERVTPSGRAVVGSYQYDKSGYAIGGRGRHGGPSIMPFTPEHAQELTDWNQKRALLDAVDKIKWRDLTPEQVTAALPVIQSLVPA
jgi:hypothetical protein